MGPSAADFKFLYRLPHVGIRNLKSKSGTRNHVVASAPLFPKFVSEYAAMDHELRKRGTRA